VTQPPYNPLDKFNLARSVEGELLSQPACELASVDHITGAGVYVIYYQGTFKAYAPIAEANRTNLVLPIYVGKAIPKGGRKGGLSKDVAKSRALADRLRQHAASIDESSNLELEDFRVRHLVVDDIWIPLGENMLIESFKPVWNRAVDGFGNKDPGRRRATQFKSPWDVLHPGREFAEKLADSTLTEELVLRRVDDHFAGRPLTKLPKAVAEQQAEEEALEDLDDVTEI
jgi:Eco29kI restriction endonuclease